MSSNGPYGCGVETPSQRPHKTSTSDGQSSTKAFTSAVLPMPASPRIRTIRPVAVAASSRERLSVASGSSRSTSWRRATAMRAR